MAAKGPRENITLECTECKSRNYTTTKNKEIIQIDWKLLNIVNSVKNVQHIKRLNS